MMKEEAEKNLKQLDGWKLVGNAIEKDYKFSNFRQAVDFINRVAEVAETEDHHPDILLWSWNNVRLTLTTHAVGGLSKNDFALASRVNRIKLK